MLKAFVLLSKRNEMQQQDVLEKWLTKGGELPSPELIF